jgi:alpha-beta hydrolase superfamily lysophospholipase
MRQLSARLLCELNNFVSGLVLLGVLAGSTAWGSESCRAQIGAAVQRQNEAQNTSYLSRTGEGIKAGNGWQYRPGTSDRIVSAVHGYLASPYEVEVLARELNQHGHSVISPLVYGFGSGYPIQGLATLKDMRESLLSAIAMVQSCDQPVELVGVSWGATLVSDFLLFDPRAQLKVSNGQSLIHSVTLISPYYQAKKSYAEFFNRQAAHYVNHIPLRLLAPVMQTPELTFANTHPNFYNHDVSLPGILLVLAYHETINAFENQIKSQSATGPTWQIKIPVYLAVTESDQTVDVKFAKEFVTRHFTNLHVKDYAASAHADHLLIQPSNNPQLPELLKEIAEFIETQ